MSEWTQSDSVRRRARGTDGNGRGAGAGGARRRERARGGVEIRGTMWTSRLATTRALARALGASRDEAPRRAKRKMRCEIPRVRARTFVLAPLQHLLDDSQAERIIVHDEHAKASGEHFELLLLRRHRLPRSIRAVGLVGDARTTKLKRQLSLRAPRVVPRARELATVETFVQRTRSITPCPPRSSPPSRSSRAPQCRTARPCGSSHSEHIY